MLLADDFNTVIACCCAFEPLNVSVLFLVEILHFYITALVRPKNSLNTVNFKTQSHKTHIDSSSFSLQKHAGLP